MILIITLLFSAYLIGSIPTSVWIGKAIYGIDIRNFGSGNAGTTNTFRVLGQKAGIFVFIFDTFKGFISIKLISLTHFPHDSKNFINFSILLGIASIIGHILPIYAQFRGGKGVASTLGVITAIHPVLAIILLTIFTVLLVLTKYVSLSSIISAICFPLLLLFYFHEVSVSLIIFSFIISSLVILTHLKNIRRLFLKEEKKIYILRTHRRR